jgi:hypothetical protein
MSDRQLHKSIYRRAFTNAKKFLIGGDSSRSDEKKEKAKEERGKNKPARSYRDRPYVENSALMVAAIEGDASEEQIRAMIKNEPHSYIDSLSAFGITAANYCTRVDNATLLDLLLTIGANPKGCMYWARVCESEACLAILRRFEQRITLACCLRHYDDLHLSSPLFLHPDIAALKPFAKILHDLHGINGDMHSFSRKILSYI